jgi:SAM-dependent methyltransferase
MLAHARRRVPDGEFHVGELDRLPLPDDSADVIVCALALVHVPRLQPVLAEFARVLRPGGDLVISDMHHEQVTRGSVITARGPAGEPCIAATYRHQLGDYLRAALSLGFQLRGCEEPGGWQPGEQSDVPLPEPATWIGDWQDWPWSLMDYLPSVARASRGRRLHWSSGTSSGPLPEPAVTDHRGQCRCRCRCRGVLPDGRNRAPTSDPSLVRIQNLLANRRLDPRSSGVPGLQRTGGCP